MASRFNCDGVEVTYNDITYYVAVLPVSVIFSTSKVSRADEDPEKGYQRLLSDYRTNKISDYINDGNVIPGSIILSAQPVAKIRFSDGKLSFEKTPSAFLVIDGQHRLYGCHKSDIDVPMAVCIFQNLDLVLEVQYFLDINGTQRGVPRTLQLEIAKFTAEPESLEDIRLRLFRELNDRVDSPLHNKMSPTRSVRGKLSHVPFQAALNPILEVPPMLNLSFEQKTKLLINILNALNSILLESNAPRNVENAALFQAFFRSFPEIIRQVELRYRDFKESSFYEVLKPLQEIDWSIHSGTNKKAIQDLSHEIMMIVSDSKMVSDDLF